MPENEYTPTPENQVAPEFVRQETLGQYTAKTFGLMFLGLMVTFGIAFYLSNTVSGWLMLVQVVRAVPYIQWVILVAELVVVIAMSAMLQKMSPTTAAVCFFVYAVLTGLTFGIIFTAYDVGTLALIFGFTALYFGGMAVFGFVTKVDLSRIRNLLLGGLIALIVVNVLMLFIPGLQVLDRVLCTIGVVIFLAYTAYDTQKLKAYYYGFQGDDAMLKKASIISALELYLDFINLFLYLLRLFGKSNKN